ncbi:MAG: 4-hydroxythreonine-4-phosphate dehydrogenase PdxA [Xanthobacteraceae bacterium]|nr:4-hydroxythreonine-4-phosphate dehydrogenase PdxA [Xanthobacteraceae bacterium]
MLPLALTLGEPAGIGPDLAIQLWSERKARKLPPFFLVADPAFIAGRANALKLDIPIGICEPEETAKRFDDALLLIDPGAVATAAPGKPDASSANAARASIDLAVRLVQRKRAAAVVTNPIAKHVMQAGGFAFPGHTEYLAHLSNAPRPVMLIWSEELAVIPITIHMPLRDVPEALSTGLIVESARIAARDYREKFDVKNPRLAVCGLNPHAGEEGTIGREDIEIIAPAIRALRDEGIEASGPHPADSLFHEHARKYYDVALGMYHDQVLAPVKALAFDRAVNVTLGLPFVRTSPDHGTAFDLAGSGTANPSSLEAALKLAARLSANA